ncbi:hypothetical protein PAHAL_7G249100 [Panicum hallii]|uniref:Uncharacterized protein n=1 Tax=Panicum hallii TaxID=206008 RepID=A0A2T8IDF3_9POAL|nr:hypothetical protein PAHAL_7G249100 [Panicum hallii]
MLPRQTRRAHARLGRGCPRLRRVPTSTSSASPSTPSHRLTPPRPRHSPRTSWPCSRPTPTGARPARGAPRQALRLAPPRHRRARPDQRVRRRGGRADAQRRGVQAALPGRVDASRQDGRRAPASA